MALVHANALVFADGSSRHGCQDAAAAACGHSSCRSADTQHAELRPPAHCPVFVERHRQTLRTRKHSRRLDATHKARRRTQRSQ